MKTLCSGSRSPATSSFVLIRQRLRSCGAGAFACQPIFPRLLTVAAQRLQVLFQGLGILPPRASVEGMRVRPEACIGFQLPVLQVVPRLKARPREIGRSEEHTSEL